MRDHAAARKGTGRIGLLLAAWALAIVAAATPAGAAPAVEAVLSADQNTFAAGEPVVVHLALRNTGTTDLRILRWRTPEAGSSAPLFSVTGDGAAPAYRGRLAKRGPAGDGDYLVLPAGQSTQWTVTLSDLYSFPATAAYAVTYDVSSPDLLGPGMAGALSSNTLEIDVAGRASRARRKLQARAVTGTSGFVSCSAPEQADILAARDDASVYAGNAVEYLDANLQDSRYVTWFGAYTSGRYATVALHFDNVQSAVDTATPMTFDCSCSEAGTFAYVYPDAPYEVYLCPEFWNAPAIGSDSKAGTLIHEITHFDIVAGTDDFVYGETDAANLAASNPNQAVMNADNHEYFAEAYAPVVVDDAVCPPTPATCGSSGKALLKIKDIGVPAKASLLWKWSAGTIALADLGDPTEATNYRLCVYDGSTLLSQPQFSLGGSGSWQATATGFRYSNPTTNSGGFLAGSIKSGDGKGLILVKAKGVNLELPALPLAPSTDLRVQLVKNAGAECWESAFSTGDIVSSSTSVKATLP